MKRNKLSFFLSLVLLVVAATSCQKMDRPGVGTYPADANPPGGPLKFYVAFDGSSSDVLRNAVDSIRANFPAANSGTSVDGISGKAYQGSPSSFVQFGAANDFAGVTSFTLSFWLKKTPQAAGTGTNFAFSLNAKDYSWTKLQMFLLFEDAGNPSTVDSAACKFYLLDQWFEFVGTKRIKNLLNGEWHHLAFTYDETTSTLSTYVDGQAPTNLPAGFGNVSNGGSPRGPLTFSGTSGFTIGGAGDVAKSANGWMGNFDGQLDQFRLYGVALSASEINALFQSRL